jgi:hypothetical protein
MKKTWIKFICWFFGHDWTSAIHKNIPATPEQLSSGLVGYAEYAKLWCERCGKVCQQSEDFIEECKQAEE